MRSGHVNMMLTWCQHSPACIFPKEYQWFGACYCNACQYHVNMMLTCALGMFTWCCHDVIIRQHAFFLRNIIGLGHGDSCQHHVNIMLRNVQKSWNSTGFISRILCWGFLNILNIPQHRKTSRFISKFDVDTPSTFANVRKSWNSIVL